MQRVMTLDFKKQKPDYKLFVSKFYTGPCWTDICINPNCQNRAVRDNEYATNNHQGLNRENASTNNLFGMYKKHI